MESISTKMHPGVSPTRIRYAILTIAAADAFVLYLDRICMGAVVQSQSFQHEFGLSKDHIGDVLAAFFLAYAFGQLPAGWFADRFGPRRMLVTYILLWSTFTALTSLAGGLTALVAIRAMCGLTEAGAYPASALLITRWFSVSQRGRANSVVSFGGRIGNALALWLTAGAIAVLGSWRPVLWIYGVSGITLAILTKIVFRDDPSVHPWVNVAERQQIGTSALSVPSAHRSFPWLALLRHPGLWLLNIASVGMNIGWAFLITWLPTYLHEVRHLDPVTASRYVSVALGCGLMGMLFGGWLCDTLRQCFGQRWGRRLPFVLSGSAAVIAYVLCPHLDSGLAVAVACGVVAFANDCVLPAVWAFAQDIGKSHVASTLAWSNMWGNLGASTVARVIPFLLASSFHRPDWTEVFWVCAAGYVLLGGCAIFIDSTKPLRLAAVDTSPLPVARPNLLKS